MWARTIEFILGIWLAISWIIFSYQETDTFLFWNDMASFILIGFFSLLSYLEKLRHLHLLNFLLGTWLCAISYYLRAIGYDAGAQNYMTIGLLILMLSIIPTHSRRPPYRWIKFMNKNDEEQIKKS